MEYLNDSNSTNNNVVDNLDVLKDSQLNAMKTDEQINNFVENQDDSKSDDLLANLTKATKSPENSIDLNNLVDEIKELNKENELINDLLTDNQNKSTAVSEVNELIDQNVSQVNELTESTKRLLDDLNDSSAAALDQSSNVLNSSNLENLTAENFLETNLEQSLPSVRIVNSVVGDFLDSLVRESDVIKDETLETTQEESLLDNSNKENLNLSAKDTMLETTQEESLLDSSLENSLTNQSIPAINLLSPDESAQEFSLIDVSSGSIAEAKNEETTLLDQLINQSEVTGTNKELLQSVEKNESKDGGFFNELNQELNKTVDQFISDIKPNDEIEAKVGELKNEDDKQEAANLHRDQTFIVSETNESLNKELKHEENNEQVNKFDDKGETSNLVNEAKTELASKTSKSAEIMNQSQEILKQADKLISSQRNSIDAIGLGSDQTNDQQATNQAPSSEKPQSSETAKPTKQSSKKCIIS